MADIKQVAREAGVSIATVSRVVNGHSGAARPETAARVRAAIERLQYQPNAIARGLNRQRMNTLGVVFASADDFVLTAHDYYIRILEGILTVNKAGHQKTLLFLQESWQQAKTEINSYTDGQCDGLILLSPAIDDSFYETLRRKKVPVVITGGVSPEMPVSAVTMDNETVGYDCARHLLGLGHQRISHLGGNPKFDSTAARARGYERALREQKLKADVLPGEYGAHSGYAQTRLLLQRQVLPTALFCADDEIAYGALDALAEAGVSVPGEMSVIGVNDSPKSVRQEPPLTSVRQPYRQIGRRLAEILREEIEGQSLPGQQESYPGEMVVRFSTAPPGG